VSSADDPTTPVVTVLVGARPHAVSGRPGRSRADATAAALALGLDPRARLLSAGDMSDAVARDYLALGASRIDIVDAAPRSDAAALAAALLPALADVAWVLTGTRPEAEHGTGMLPYVLAQALGRPLVTDVLSVEPDGPAWIVTQALPRGARRRLRVMPPAVLAASAAANPMLRHALSAAMAGRIVRRVAEANGRAPDVMAPDATPARVPAAGLAPPRLVPKSQRRQPLAAHTVQSGHARMLGAIESPSTGGAVLRQGDAESKAQAVLDYLRSHSLVPF
jgi:electron transfer flavoprotein beta subunit